MLEISIFAVSIILFWNIINASPQGIQNNCCNEIAQSGYPYSNIHSGQFKVFAFANVGPTDVFYKNDNNICIWNAEENDLSESPQHKRKSQSH